jgi:hypothetical protein
MGNTADKTYVQFRTMKESEYESARSSRIIVTHHGGLSPWAAVEFRKRSKDYDHFG